MTAASKRRRAVPNEGFYRRFLAPEERKERRLDPWCGDFRWFASDNVVALEVYRTKEDWEQIRARFWPKQ
jgi:hypothetical protein